MNKKTDNLPFADSRRAASLLAHWLDDNDDGLKQVMMEARELNREQFLIMALLNLTFDLNPSILRKVDKIRARALEMAHAETIQEDSPGD